MKEQSTYLTISNRSEGVYKEKGSKFIGIALPCHTSELAKEQLTEIKKEHQQARHLCYAYRFGLNGEAYRSNDDGEPSNSAGAPILGQLQSFNVTNVLIGVVRYYGGTKLGVGGLINAYRTAAREALNDAKIIEHEVFEWVEIRFEYIDMAPVMNLLKKNQLEMVNSSFELNCSLETNLPLHLRAKLKTEFEKLETVAIKTRGIY